MSHPVPTQIVVQRVRQRLTTESQAAAAAADEALRLDPTNPTKTAPGLAGAPRAYREAGDIVVIHLPRGVTVEQARAAAGGVRAAFLDPGPWVPLSELRPGTIFELKSGDVGMVRAEPAVDPDRVRVVYTARGEDAEPLGVVLARLLERPAREVLTRVVREWEFSETGQLDGAVILEARALLGLAATPDPLDP